MTVERRHRLSALLSYTCQTCGEHVGNSDVHEHNCPLDDYPGEKCGLRHCNETGRCQR